MINILRGKKKCERNILVDAPNTSASLLLLHHKASLSDSTDKLFLHSQKMPFEIHIGEQIPRDFIGIISKL